jgi:hypothetical protein
MSSNASRISSSIILEGEQTLSKLYTNKPGILNTGSLAVIYTCSSTGGAVINSLQLANNTASTTQFVQITLYQNSTHYTIVNNLSIPSGCSVSAISDKIILKTGDAIYGVISTGSNGGVHALISLEEYSS